MTKKWIGIGTDAVLKIYVSIADYILAGIHTIILRISTFEINITQYENYFKYN